MERLTKQREDAAYFVEEAALRQEPPGYSGEAVDRLAIFENVYEHLLENQAEIVKELEVLKQDGKTKTVKFRQLLANKITNGNFLALFHTYGL